MNKSEIINLKNDQIKALKEQVEFLQNSLHEKVVTITELRTKIDEQSFVMRISDDICAEMFLELESLNNTGNENTK